MKSLTDFYLVQEETVKRTSLPLRDLILAQKQGDHIRIEIWNAFFLIQGKH